MKNLVNKAEKILAGLLVAVVSTMVLEANGTFVTEKFSCDVANADKAYLETAIPDETDEGMQQMLISQLESTKKAIEKNGGCK